MIVPPLRTLDLPRGADKTRAAALPAWIAAVLGAALVAGVAGCGRGDRPDERVRLPVDVAADTSRTVRLRPADSLPAIRTPDTPGVSPRASAWLARVSPQPPPRLEPSVETAEPQIGSWPVPPALEVEEGLKPPIARGSATLRVPRGATAGWVELDVRVDETGAVSDVEWAGGATDSARIEAATAYAFAMRWFPALQGGRPIAVWCRQRVDFGR